VYVRVYTRSISVAFRHAIVVVIFIHFFISFVLDTKDSDGGACLLRVCVCVYVYVYVCECVP